MLGEDSVQSQKVRENPFQRIKYIRSDLAELGAPEDARRPVSAAARPGIYIGDALAALSSAEKALERANADPAIAAAQAELLSTYRELYREEYWWTATPTPSPPPRNL